MLRSVSVNRLSGERLGKAASASWLLSLRSSDRLRDTSVAIVASIAVCLPMLVTGQAFFEDWQNHLYLVAKQASYVRQHVLPTYFVNTVELGWFYPYYAFYGGTLYYLVAVAAVALGSAWKAYVGSYVLSVVAAFGGWSWLARQAGMRGWPRYLPGCVFVCGAYYLSNAYGRGAWPEFVAVSMIPLVLASAWSILSNQVRTPAVVVALLASTAVLAGSHIITLVFGTLFVAGALAAGLVVLRPWTTAARGLVWLLGIGALALGLSAWFLVPVIRYRDTVRALATALEWPEYGARGVLFSLFPTIPSACFPDHCTPQLYVQAAVVPLIVELVVAVIGVLFVRSLRLTAFTGCALMGLFIVAILVRNDFGVWGKLPREALVVQFTYRLNSYLLACIAGLMILACRFAQQVRDGHRRVGATLLGVLGVATLVQVGFAGHQVWRANTYGPAEKAVTNLGHLPGTWYDRNYFSSSVPISQTLVPDRPWVGAFAGSDDMSPLCDSVPLAPGVECWVRTMPDSFDVSSIQVPIPPNATGDQIKTNIVPSAFIAFDPLHLVGQDGDHAVVRGTPTDGPTALQAHLVWTTAIRFGVALTVVSLILAVGLLLLLGVRGWRRSRQATSSSPKAGDGSVGPLAPSARRHPGGILC